jgi:bacterioferritin-associated ferredoxin
MDKKVTEVIREWRRKEKEEIKKKCAINSQCVAHKIVQTQVEKQHRTNFN